MTATSPNWPVVGHEMAVELLARAVRSGQIAHAYLFAGPEGVGRRTLARIFTQALLCTAAPASRPCGTCSACRRVARGIHPDVSTVSLENQAADDTRNRKNTRISIETIRELRASIALRPLEADWRVAVIEDVDLLSRDAFDALLKTLEEPPPFVILVLIATEQDAVPDTIRSRCHPIVLEPLPRQAVARVLEERGVDAAEAAVVASITRGRLGHALVLAGDQGALTARRVALDGAIEMLERPLSALGSARRMADAYRRGQRAQVEQQLDVLVGVWRDVLLIAGGYPDGIVNADVRERVAALAGRWSVREIQRGLAATHEALLDLAANAQPRLVLDAMVTQWPRTR
ncbi:MAG TPA: DNA polymerase III subunit delta' [Thermomicrobiaceae bacterium]|nr:DNA polymerase III subunit delta' [Thermomicrobiaceae bacterium]